MSDAWGRHVQHISVVFGPFITEVVYISLYIVSTDADDFEPEGFQDKAAPSDRWDGEDEDDVKVF